VGNEPIQQQSERSGRRVRRTATHRPASTDQHRRQLLADYNRTRSAKIRELLVSTYTPLARSIATRFQGRGVPMEDLHQVACIGLILAIDRYNSAQGASFETYLWPTIVGEIKRHFRDCAWHMKVPRRRQELAVAVRNAQEALTFQWGRSPTVTEVAAELQIAEESVLAAMELAHAYQLPSLEQRMFAPAEPGGAGDKEEESGGTDGNLDAFEMRHAVGQALARLDDRKRLIIRMRYFQQQTQRQVALQLGLSQMQISRLERQALRQLKEMFRVE
jgi:RNA polymerase sigma-B factor